MSTPASQPAISPTTSQAIMPPGLSTIAANIVVLRCIADFLPLQHSCAVDTVTSVRQSLETCLGNLHLTFLALAKGVSLNALQGCGSFRQGLPLILQQGKRDLLLESVGAQVSRVERQVGKITISCPMKGFLPKIEDIPS